jgi:hypothetical protein
MVAQPPKYMTRVLLVHVSGKFVRERGRKKDKEEKQNADNGGNYNVPATPKVSALLQFDQM